MQDPLPSSRTFHNPWYRIGCPVWACERWKGSVFAPSAPRADWLVQYSRCFNCVEGNSTFYGIPKVETFQRWAEQSAPGFQFCLKFPRTVSHEARLAGAEDSLRQFLQGLDCLAKEDCLGPTLLQLGPGFDGSLLDRLVGFLRSLPSEYPYAVEVRHPDWFQPELQSRFFDVLNTMGIDRVIFDSRALFVGEAKGDYEVASRKRKPRVPIRARVTGKAPMLRLIGRDEVGSQPVTDAIEEWTEVVALWIQQGLNPIVFTHAPDDQFAPQFALRFHNRLAERLDQLKGSDQKLNTVTKMPYEPAATQQSLF